MKPLAAHRIAPDAYKALVWDVFFASRGRGLSLQRHFPWLDETDDNTWYVTADHDGAVVGGLSVREEGPADERVASIGLVCVHPSHRGQGLSQNLLGRAIAQARARGVAALRLWTAKPEVYRPQGFVEADSALFGWLEQLPSPVRASAVEVWCEAWPPNTAERKDSRGLPPFARSASRWCSADATVILLEDAGGPIVAEWTGDAGAVASLMGRVLPPRARLNAIEGDALLPALQHHGWICDLVPSHLQMVMPLNGGREPHAWAHRHAARVLSRI